jgi:Zn-dependent protease
VRGGFDVLRGSIKLGSLLGVPVYLHWTFLILIAWLVGAAALAGGPGAMAAGLRTGAFVLAVFGCIVLHEMGHALAARRYGIRTRDITLLPIGGVASLERMPEKPGQELVVALAGPAVNVVIAGVLLPLVLLTAGVDAFHVSGGDGEGGAGGLHRLHFLAALGATNVLLVVFNMIPALPMDGGRVLRALLAMAMDRAKATAIAATVGQIVAAGFVIFGLFSGQVLLMLVGLFVFFGAGAEASAERFRAALEGLRVEAAMITRFRTLRTTQTLREAAAELLAGSQQDFPVVDADAPDPLAAGALVGVLTRSRLVRAMAGGNLDATVGSVMVTPCATAREGEDLRRVLDRARTARGVDDGSSPDGEEARGVIAVVRGSGPEARIVGVVTQENVAELVMLREAADGVSRRVSTAG